MSRLALEWRTPGQHFVKDHAEGVEIDLATVLAVADFGSHVVAGPDAFGLTAPFGIRNELRQSVVADFDHAQVIEQIRRFEIAMDQPLLMQVLDPLRGLKEPTSCLLDRQAARLLIQRVAQVRSGDILHHHPPDLLLVSADVVQRDQIRVFEIQALRRAAEFDLQIALDPLERDFLASIAEREVDLAEAADTEPTLDRETVQHARAAAERKMDRGRFVRAGHSGRFRSSGS